MGKLQRLGIVVVAVVLAGCVTRSPIVPDGPDGYRIFAHGKSGAQSSSKMQADNYAQADSFCAERGKVVETLDSETKRSRPLGGFPEAELRFRCVDRGQP